MRAGLGLALLLALSAGCSRSSSKDAPRHDTTGMPAPTPVPTSSEAAASPGSVLTPEDVEQEAEGRITEQNLESELDRLEREIQGE